MNGTFLSSLFNSIVSSPALDMGNDGKFDKMFKKIIIIILTVK